jgi:hypothetical protein
MKEGDHLEEPGVDGRKILKWIFRTWDGHGLDLWNGNLVQDREKRHALVIAAMNLRVP